VLLPTSWDKLLLSVDNLLRSDEIRYIREAFLPLVLRITVSPAGDRLAVYLSIFPRFHWSTSSV
jgi:hypothetical protein